MNQTERKRLKIWAVLVVVFGLTLWAGQRVFDLPTVLDAVTNETDIADTAQDLDLDQMTVSGQWARLDIESSLPDGPRRNPFQYGPEPVLEAPPAPFDPLGVGPAVEPPAPLQPPAPPPPPPPPPIPFRYSGWSRVGDDDGVLEAWLFDEGDAYSVVEQEVLMGRYRINQITDQFVEIEDLEFNRRQRLPLLVQ
jgi:hypothetical protein